MERARVPTRTQAFLTVALLSLVSTSAMLGITNRADERWHPYTYGPEGLAEPLDVVVYPVRFAFAAARNLGNFRPLGRVVEHVNYVVDEVLSITTGLPLHVVLGLVRMLSAAVLGVVLVAVAHRLVGSRRTLVPFAVAGAFPGLLVAYGALSSMVVFSGMYLQTTILIVLAIGLFTGPHLYEPDGRLKRRTLVGYALFGVTVAVFNELAYVAAPAAGATLLALLVASRAGWRRWWSLPATRLGVATGGGFLAAAIPVRLYLAAACTGPDASCYVASNPAPGGVTAAMYLNRIIAGLPLASWRSGPFFNELTLVAALAVGAGAIILAVLWWGGGEEPADDADATAGTGASTHDADDVPTESTQRPWWVPVVVGAVLVLSAAAIASLSGALQGARNPWQGWREAPVLFAGWALVLGGLAGTAADRVRRPWGLLALVVVASLGVGSAVVGTTFQHARDARDQRLVLTETIGVEIASFERSEAGDERRCSLVADFIRLHPDAPSQVRRLREAVDKVAQDRHGLPFCSETSDA